MLLNIEVLVDKVCMYLEVGQIDGFVCILWVWFEVGGKVLVFVFYLVGGLMVVYELLLGWLLVDILMYGFEWVEGLIEECVQQYVLKLIEMQGDGFYVLVGWLLGGVLVYVCVIGLWWLGKDVWFVGLIDVVCVGEEILQIKEEICKCWDCYVVFVEKMFNVIILVILYEQFEEFDDEGQVWFVLDVVSQFGVQILVGIIEY